MAQSHTPCNRCVRFATTVASGHATLATKRTLLLTWAGLPPAGSRQLCLAHSFDHLVGAGEQDWRHIEAKRLGGLEVDRQLELDRALDGKLARFRALKDAIGIGRGAPKIMDQISSVGQQATELSEVTERIDGGRRWRAASAVISARRAVVNVSGITIRPPFGSRACAASTNSSSDVL